MDESEVPRTASRSEWLALFLKIAKGKALAIPESKAPASSIREALKRLKDAERLGENYLFTSRKQPDGTYVSYVINSASEPQGKERRSHVRTQRKSPVNAEEIRKFILSNQSNGYENSLPGIQMKFYGKPLSSRDDPDEYHRSYNMTRRVREQLERELGGKFVEELRNDGSKVYRLKK